MCAIPILAWWRAPRNWALRFWPVRRCSTRAGGKLRDQVDEGRQGFGGATRDIAVDALIMSAGWTPSVHMYSQSRGKVVWDEEAFAVPARP
jgi:NADPH-dependent 2,4-dienoyl-CoA reductase/sulfur reductase-like enzyme